MTGAWRLFARVTAGAIVLTAACGARATEGYFLAGYGATQTSLAGAGVANSTDAMAQTLNPAGLVDVDREFQLGLSLFAPTRGYDASGTVFVAPGSPNSSIPVFLLPNAAYSQPIDASSAWGVAFYSNGGMNTYYRDVTNYGFFCRGANGVYCGAATGVNLSQAFLQADYARTFGAVSIGVAPLFAFQQFSGEGFGAFQSYSASPPTSPTTAATTLSASGSRPAPSGRSRLRSGSASPARRRPGCRRFPSTRVCSPTRAVSTSPGGSTPASRSTSSRRSP